MEAACLSIMTGLVCAATSMRWWWNFSDSSLWWSVQGFVTQTGHNCLDQLPAAQSPIPPASRCTWKKFCCVQGRSSPCSVSLLGRAILLWLNIRISSASRGGRPQSLPLLSSHTHAHTVLSTHLLPRWGGSNHPIIWKPSDFSMFSNMLLLKCELYWWPPLTLRKPTVGIMVS